VERAAVGPLVRLSSQTPGVADYRQEARRAARRYGLDPHIFERQIRQESGFNPNAVSPAGATGIAQIMPATARGWGVNPRDPLASLDAAAKNMAAYVKKYGGYENALRAYNAGPGAIEASRGYAETNNYVKTILGGRVPASLGRPVRNTGSSATPTGSAPASSPGTPQITDGGQAGDFTSLLSSLLTRPEQQQAAPMPIAPPSFAAAPRLPQGFTPATSIAPVRAPQQDRVSQALSLVEALGSTGPTVGSPGAPEGAEGTTAAPGIAETVVADRSRPRAATGKIIVAPNANREGVGLSRQITRFVERIAGIYGKPLTIGTGTNHNQFVAGTHRESAHWRGNGADIPAAGKTLTRLGQDALIAAGMPAREARKQTGGLFNIGRYQVIFNSNEGGNHYDHLHVGLRG
jgi:hypothetical protein